MKKATSEDMELGNILFGNSRGIYQVEPRGDYQEIFCKFLYDNNFDSYGYKADNKERVFENDVFIIRPYYWGDDEEEARKPNFVYKPTNLEIKWYKYPMRDAYSNQDVDIKTFKSIINECHQSLNKRKIVEKIVEMYEDEMADWEIEMPDIIRCKNCIRGIKEKDAISCNGEIHPYDWYCADGISK